MRRLTLYFFILLAFHSILASPVLESEALKTATRFHQLRSPSRLRSAEVLKLVYQGTSNKLRSSAGVPAFYIYNIGDRQGFVIVSGEDATKSILGYADEGSFKTDSMPDHLKGWLNFYQLEIEAIRNATLTSTVSEEQISEIATGTSMVAPLLGGIKWDQTNPYNLLCPWDAGASSRTLAGCVAVAMAQIMDYYEWPIKGTGSNSYTDETYGVQTVDFSKTTYDWTNMLDYYGTSATEQQKTAVSTLIYHCGVAVDMAYSLTGSSANIVKAAEAFVSHFGYDHEIQRYERLYYSDYEWNTIIKNELNNARPVYFSGSSDDGGHAFVCDGYDSNNLFHINWGWGGSSNGYFELSSLSSDNPGIVGANPGYSQHQSILTKIHKADAINQINSQLVVYKNGLSATKSSVSNIATSTFDLNFSFTNAGISNVSARWGIGYIKDGTATLTKLVEYSTNPTTFLYGSVYSFPFTISKPTVLSTAGTYRLYPIFMPAGTTTWNIIRGTNSLNNCIIVTVASNKSATILPGLAKPALILDQSPQPLSRLYANKSVNVDVSIKNLGPEFFSRVGLSLLSATDPGDRTYICESNVFCAVGETKTFHLAGTVNCPPGNYYLQVQFDSTNSNTTMNYKLLGPTNLNHLLVEVLASPGLPNLGLNSLISMQDGTIISKNDTINLSANITNSGGFFDSRILAFVYPKGGGPPVGLLTPKYFVIDSLETKNIVLTGTMDLNIGEYRFIVYHYIDTTWLPISPNKLSTLDFTVTSTSSTPNQTIEPQPIYIYQEGNMLVLETKGKIQQTKVYDLGGRLVLKTTAKKNLPVGNLSAGMYLLNIELDGNRYNQRIIIEKQ